MTTLKVKDFAQAHDLIHMTGYVTLTRYQDPANNSNKFRRFITISAPGERTLLITHTGRWTGLTQAGHWSGGTYRPQGLARGTTHRSYPDAESYNKLMVSRKLGEYTVTSQGALAPSEINEALRLADRLEPVTAPAAPASGAPAAQAAPAAPPAAKPYIAPTPASTPPPADLAGRISHLLGRASTPGEDPFDLFADLAILRGEVKAEQERVAEMNSQLGLISEIIVAAT